VELKRKGRLGALEALKFSSTLVSMTAVRQSSLPARTGRRHPLNCYRERVTMIVGPSAEARLRDKLRKIEALFAGAGTPGEKAAADAAADRIRARLGKAVDSEALEEIRFSIPDNWSRQLFIALCRRYGISPFRYRRMHRQTIIVKAPRNFAEEVLWPEFRELSAALSAYLAEITEKLIREEVHGETADVEEREEPRRLGR
jgi:hypothetical protein